MTRRSFGRSVRNALAFAVLTIAAVRAPAAEPPAPAALSAEYQLKAAYLFKLPQFVEWPAGAFADAQAPFVIGILGEDPFGVYLDDFVRDEKMDTHPIVVRRFRRGEEARGCHVLYIGRSEGAALEKIFAQLRRQPTLTVGDLDEFARLGGMIHLVVEDGRIHFSINADAAKAAGLDISSKLLRLATIVPPPKR
ncbi:MAG TPA: YfiR family protein [Opitutaceae bacterium]|nr:YfiR family protein [Opitutaceae bacterium]